MPRLPGNFGEKIVSRVRKSLMDDALPHYRVGGKEIFLPTARVILLRPNAKHTPYQAKFIVPKSFNKLDLRDYLFKLYGLKALNITTQLLHSKFYKLTPWSGRFRGPQIKKMTIEMSEPFIWPDEPDVTENDNWDKEMIKNMEIYKTEQEMRLNSDKYKPTKAFDGVVNDYRAIGDKTGPQPFIPRSIPRSKHLHQKQSSTARSPLTANPSTIDRLNNFVNHGI